MVRNAVNVVVRTRPTSNFAEKFIQVDTEKHCVTVNKSSEEKENKLLNNVTDHWKFRLDRVLYNETQNNVYELCGRDICESVLQGFNGTIMAYGQTGAGKTFTINGGSQNYSSRGLIPRAINHVFASVQSKPEIAYTIRISYLEIYNEKFFDLLNDHGANLTVTDDNRGQVSVKGLTRVVANNEEEALNLLFTGETNRAIGQHALNAVSSRSHGIFTIHVEARSRVESSEQVMISKLNLVDLAGSERVKKTGSSGIVLKEAGFINKSLSFLEQVVIALGARSRDHVPFRSSKLTNVLRDSLGGNCKTRLIANIWPEARNLEETISTLKFACRMMRVSTEPSVNVHMDPLLLIKKQEREIAALKQELAMHDALSGRAPQHYDGYSTTQKAEFQQLVQQYCQNKISEIPISTIHQIQELFSQFRIYVQHLLHDTRKAADTSFTNETAAQMPSARPNDTDPSRDSEYVGDLDAEQSGFPVGSAPANARPDSIQLRSPKGKASTLPLSPFMEAKMSPNAKPRKPGFPLKTEEAAFEEYKLSQGRELNMVLEDKRQELREKKRQLKEISSAVNQAKRDIDELNKGLQEKREIYTNTTNGRTETDVDIIDEEEYLIIRQMKDHKKLYQKHFTEWKMIQSEVSFCKQLVQQAKIQLCNSFLEWYQQTYAVPKSSENNENVVGDDEILDDAEKFKQMELDRLMQQDPDSVAFFSAKRNVNDNMRRHKKKQVSKRILH